jgi:hypothetical protein
MFMCVCLSLKNLRDPFGNSPLDISIFCFLHERKEKKFKKWNVRQQPPKKLVVVTCMHFFRL